MSVFLDVHGAAGTVTGSCHRLTTPRGALLVDCGMFQGPKSLRALNYRAAPFAPDTIAAILLTHAHLDHAGLFPKLVREGFGRRAWATPATRDLLQWMLADAGAIQEVDVDRLNRRNARRGERQVEPIYTRADAEASVKRISTEDYDAWFEPAPGVRARFRNAGHILGSAFVELEIDAKPRPIRFVFSGDLGPTEKSLQHDPQAPEPADVALIEATYGDRPRERMSEADRRACLGRELEQALAAGGNVVIPAFAVERTQEILRDVALLRRGGALEQAVVYLDSPLAGRTTEVFRRHRSLLDLDETGALFPGGGFHVVETVDASRALERRRQGSIILAGSGMCDAGRVKLHLENNLWRPECTVLFVGYQAPGTLGAAIRDGAPSVRIHGEEIAVKARIRSIDTYSGHADRDELVEWARPMLPGLGAALLVHGEPPALEGLAAALAAAGLSRDRISIPRLDQRFEIVWRDDAWVAVHAGGATPRLAPEEAVAPRDWHNEYARSLLDLRAAIKRAPDDASRVRLLGEIRRLLDEAPRRDAQ